MTMRSIRSLILPALLVAACSSDKGASDSKGPGAAQKPAATTPDAGKPGARPTQPGADDSKTRHAAHLRAGRAAAKKKDWKTAMTEFDAAHQAIPEDAVALSELGWAAFNAGDLDRAQKANEEAVKLAKDPKLKAASLYNLGRVAEAKGDKETAKAMYTQSLELRPNDTVAKRLAALGGTAPAAATPKISVAAEPGCPEPQSAKKLCDCLLLMSASEEDRDYEDEEEGAAPELPAPEGVCKPVGAKVAGAQVWQVGYGPAETELTGYFLVAGEGDRLTSAATLVEGLEGGRRWVRSFKLGKVEERTAGTRRYLWVEGTIEDYEEIVAMEPIETTVQWVTICPIPADPAAQLSCPLRAPLAYEQVASLEEGTDAQDVEDFKKIWGTAPPYKVRSELSITVAADGAATVKVKKGKPIEEVKPYLGTHKLW